MVRVLILIAFFVFPAVAWSEPFKQQGDIVTGGPYADTDSAIAQRKALRDLWGEDSQITAGSCAEKLQRCVKGLQERAKAKDRQPR